MKAHHYNFMGNEYEYFPLKFETQTHSTRAGIYPEALAALAKATLLSELVAATDAAASCLGFDTFTYGCVLPRINNCPMVFAFSTHSKRLMHLWHERGYSEKDPRLLHCIEYITPYAWSLEQFRVVPEMNDFVHDFEQEGLCAGAVIPLNFHLTRPITCKAMLSLNSRDIQFWNTRASDKMRIFGDASVLATSLQQRLLDLQILWREYLGREQLLASLTNREWEVLITWSGETYKAIARKLGISPATIRKHFASIMLKLAVRSKAELLSIARECALAGARTKVS